MIWIIGGTEDARRFVSMLDFAKGHYVVSVATEYGKSLLEEGTALAGRMDLEEMKGFISKQGIDLILNLAHPYAVEVSRNAKVAAEEMGCEYHRFLRRETPLKADLQVEDLSSLLGLLRELEGVILFTTGSKNIPDFEKVKGDSRHIYRILPIAESLKICQRSGVSPRDIIAMQGPFDREMNLAMLKHTGAAYLVFKDSGSQGGTQEKLDACEELSVKSILLKRPVEAGESELEKLRNVVIQYLDGRKS
ncbi:MAG: precorrin-6A reductase [Tissierellia bacterium]|nr:precorrin-6A reductase [Tissierellia bacterium]